ncbi:hypothetical protein HPB51_021760 [Rhipicephalus microplus]|uniref:Ammonium transporter AmtB-like domain-containing protein n=1 Tax=Rhipicephalus microplus TaxID=6941 RepID=A0A9J6DPX1_RHIMP|nr:hypothetical protein HPB51_021760 [Rhipicephalus microplus]
MAEDPAPTRSAASALSSWTRSSEVMGEEFAMFIFQLSFATTATTIVSGAMAERTNFHAYCLFSALSTLMYCIPAGWVWSRHGFLNGIGVIDFAGSACVHLLGGTSGLISALVLGPRLSWDRHSRPRMGNPTNAYDWCIHLVFTSHGSVSPISAGSGFLPSWEALLIGAVGGLCTTPVPSLLRRWLSVDDPVNAAAIHGVGGLWGMLAVGLFLDTTRYQGLRHHRLGLFKGGGGSLLGIQFAACLTIIAWSAGVTFLVLKARHACHEAEDVLVEHKEMERAANVDDDVSPVDCASPDSQRGAATPFWEAMNSECHDGLANKDSMSQQEVTIRLVANYRSNCTIA